LVFGSWTVPTSLFSSFRMVLVCTPLVADLKSYASDSPRVSGRSVMMERTSIVGAYDGGRASDAGRPSSWHFQGHCLSKGWGMREGKRGIFVDLNVEERTKVL
jgi:hypothetical protein